MEYSSGILVVTSSGSCVSLFGIILSHSGEIKWEMVDQ